MSETLYHYVNGARSNGRSQRFGDVFNPATGEVAARVPLASADETAGAIAAASAAFPGWRDTPPLKRASILFRFKELLEAHSDELVRLIAAEHGKVLADARGSLTRGIAGSKRSRSLATLRCAAESSTSLDRRGVMRYVWISSAMNSTPSPNLIQKHLLPAQRLSRSISCAQSLTRQSSTRLRRVSRCLICSPETRSA